MPASPETVALIQADVVPPRAERRNGLRRRAAPGGLERNPQVAFVRPAPVPPTDTKRS
jgi:hypothetical protein